MPIGAEWCQKFKANPLWWCVATHFAHILINSHHVPRLLVGKIPKIILVQTSDTWLMYIVSCWMSPLCLWKKPKHDLHKWLQGKYGNSASMTLMATLRYFWANIKLVMVTFKNLLNSQEITHTIHVWYIYIYIPTSVWLIFMVNVGKYTLHGSSE